MHGPMPCDDSPAFVRPLHRDMFGPACPAVDASEGLFIYLSGIFEPSPTFDLGDPGEITLTSARGQNMFLARFIGGDQRNSMLEA